MYVERLKALENVLKSVDEVTDIVRRHEITLSSFDDMPAALERLRGATTIVMITHRLSLTRVADMIHVMEGGRVVESGTWRDLLQRPGRFTALRRAQGDRPASELVVNQ